GFEAYPLDAAVLGTTKDDQSRDLMTRLAVAGFAMMNVMLLSVAVWSGAADATRDIFHLISAAIALPVVSYAGQPFFRSAWTAVKARSLNMDVPISLAIILAAGMSLFETLNGGQHAYFDAALSLTFFLLIGRFLDQKTRSAARSAAKELTALEVQTAYKITDGQSIPTAVADLCIGDTILIPTGTRVPADGRLASTLATLDRSFLTGESAPATIETGDMVQAGVVNLGAPFTFTATAVGNDTTLRRVSALVETAENSRNTYTALADKAARIYAPAVHLLALAAFIGWVWATGDIRHALNIAIAVLIITCPCALGLAVPAVATAATGKLYSQGILVKNGTALERLAEVDTIVFDKTGTLTVPGFDLSLSDLTETERSVARGLAQVSDHAVSRVIAAALKHQTPASLTNIKEIAGCGVEADYLGQHVRLGKAAWLGAGFDGTGLSLGSCPAKKLRLTEKLRNGAVEAVRHLQHAGYDVRLMSGDKDGAVKAVASALGINAAFWDLSAEEKHSRLEELAAQNHRVLMIGDGLNDAASLAAAHVGIAPSSALDASRNAADIVILLDSFETLPVVLKVSKMATRLYKQNFAIAALYNSVAIPIALLGHATPLVAALAMSASSITVLLNALRVRSVT
ncbi:MAG: copper-translocating P-type ATPase, partial [Albidovulum sp.]